jgi:hypothetical protein
MAIAWARHKQRKKERQYSVSDDPRDYTSISNAGCFNMPIDLLAPALEKPQLAAAKKRRDNVGRVAHDWGN